MGLMERVLRALLPVNQPQPSIGPSVIREPETGAWQRNLSIVANERTLLAFSAVYGCVNIISSDVGKLPVEIERANPDGSRDVLTNHPAAILFAKPNHYQTQLDFVQQIMSSVLLAGNAYALLERDQRGVVNAMHPLNPAYVWPLVSYDTGDVFYRLTLSPSTPLIGPLTKESLDANTWVVPARAIFHHRVMTVEHPLIGVSPLYAAAMSASIGVNATGGSADYLSKMARPSGVLQAPGKIDDALAKKLKKDWQDNYSGMNQGMPAVLGGGLEWKPLTISAVDMQLIDLLRFSVEDIARVYRVPPFMLGEMVKATYKTSEQMMRAYYSGCLSYHLVSLEQRLDLMLGLANDVYIEFDLDEMLRSEMDVRYAAYEKAIQSGWLAPNEVRRKEGYKKVTGGDEPFVQMQNVPLSIAAKGPPSVSGGSGGGGGDGGDGGDPGDPSANPVGEPAGGGGEAGMGGDGSDPASAAPAPDLGLSRGTPEAPAGADGVAAGESGTPAGLPLAGHYGVWVEATVDYPAGALVTHDGSTWIATAATRAKPGTCEDWKLIVKRGADGKPGKSGLGFNWRGAYKTGITYHKNDVVRMNECVWIATRATNLTPSVDNMQGWSLVMKGTP